MKRPLFYEFVCVVEHGSFTKAAEALGTSKSRLSQQISELESELGVQLLHRSTRSLTLTEVGEKFFEQSRQGIELLDNAVSYAQQKQDEMKGKIRINAIGGAIGEQVIAPAVLRFMRKYPDITVELDFGSRHANIVEERYDVVFRMGKLKDSNFIARPILALRSYICASPRFIETYGMPETPEAMARLPWVIGSIDKISLTNGEQTVECVTEHCIKCKNGHVMKEAILQGVAIARMPSIYVEQEIASGEMIELLPQWRAPTHDLAIVYPNYRFKLHRVQAFIDFMAEAFPTLPR